MGFVEDLLSETRAAVHAVGNIQLNDILKQLLLFLAQHLERHKISIESSFAPDLPPVDANPQELQQVFLNLLNNAADAMPNGGAIQVKTRLERDEKDIAWVAAAISDSGVGIAPEEQKRIFEPFFSTKGEKGTGLGLAICSKIIAQHKGELRVESEIDKGTAFTIFLPVWRVQR